MLFVLIVDHIGNVFLYFDLYGHGKLDLKFVLGRAEKVCWKQQDLSNNLHISEGEIERKIIEPRVWRKRFVYLQTHLLR